MVMIATDGNRSMVSHPFDDLIGFWPIVHQIADTPELVEVPLRQCFESGKVGVYVRNDDNFHKSPGLWRTELSRPAHASSDFDEDFVGQEAP
jgi:hypothetical protein